MSRGRPSHAQSQVYEKDLVTGRERRVTFHNGDNNSPRYDIRPGHFFYASATDELKENPLFLQQKFDAGKAGPEPLKRSPWEILPTEIYGSELNGDTIQRLTHSRGFDGELSVHPKTGQVFYSSNRLGRLQLYILDPRTGVSRLLSKDPVLNESEIAISPDGKSLVWVPYSKDLDSSQLLLSSSKSEKPVVLTSEAYFHLSPSWTPNGEEILFSANADGSDHSDIYIIKKDGSCLRRLTVGNNQKGKPSVSPDGKQMLFSSNDSGVSQLYLVPFESPAACPPLQ